MSTENPEFFNSAADAYAGAGVDVERAMERLARVAISMHCWQGDDVSGFESGAGLSGGGILATGNYPGRVRSIDELRADVEQALALIPGNHRLNLHAIYLDNGGKSVERNAIGPEHFASWKDWAKDIGVGIDFNPTLFSHPLAADGFTLSHPDKAIRDYWVEHSAACRRIGAFFGRELGKPCVTNVWIPDGFKDLPVDRKGPRERLIESLDRVFKESIPESQNLDAVESKLFGIGSESYVVGFHEFYMGYAVTRRKVLCLDAGHFHPTESIADKFSAVMPWVPRLLLHVSRGVRWDSDHVIVLNDELQAIMAELVRGDFLDRTHIGLDYFDASINRIAAWVIGTRNALKALLIALLFPLDAIRAAERDGDYSSRLALLEDAKTLPWGAVWDEYCRRNDVPVGSAWLDAVRAYEHSVLAKRS